MSEERPSVGAVVDRHRLVVCVGTGGVGKTSLSAALALGAAMRGRSAMVLTIDPARALARALGLEALRPGGERIAAEILADAGVDLPGTLDAGMLDQKSAWDAFIARHAPSDAIRERILQNPFYRQLSGSFSGSTEYMAIEELCRLDESGRYDLIVLDTPPAAHALDFFHAPDRIDRLFDRDVAGWLARPYQAAGRGAWRALGSTARFLLRRLERAAGRGTLRDVSAFFVALDALLDSALRRTQTARSLLTSRDAAFVLVTGPAQLVLAETGALAEHMQSQAVPLAGVALNRSHPLPGDGVLDAAAIAPVLDSLRAEGVAPEAVDWLARRHREACAIAEAERRDTARLVASLRPTIAFSEVPEADGDVHSIRDLAAAAAHLWS